LGTSSGSPSAAGDATLSGPLWAPGDPPVGLYIHVPFCRSICTYCAFAKGEYDRGRADAWLDGLQREIRARAGAAWKDRPRLDTVFVGGGTPSTLSAGQWERLGALVAGGFRLEPGVEFTSEANPESFDAGVARAMTAAGVNRVSFGAQSFDSAELALLGRPHDAGAVGRAVAAARDAGIANLNLDLMYGLPGQTLSILDATLERTIALGPDHVSAYCLSLEPGTPLAAAYADRRWPGADAAAREQFERIAAVLEDAGYPAYEISNFAREGMACRHNLRYWEREDVIGIGPSAHALLGGRRWVNPAPLERWLAAYAEGSGPPPRAVDPDDARFEWVFLRLRLTRGLSTRAFAEAWGEAFAAVYGETASRLAAGGHLEERDGFVRLTPRARFVSDAVFAEFAPR
jgi:oxygen-independent coproporphyrinogen-3 oxidase